MKLLKTVTIILFAPALLLGLILGSLAQRAEAQQGQTVVNRGERPIGVELRGHVAPLAPQRGELDLLAPPSGGLGGLLEDSPELTEEKVKQQFEQKSGSLQIPFIRNKGQVDETVAFYAQTFGGTVYVTHQGEIVYSLPKVEETTADELRSGASPDEERVLPESFASEDAYSADELRSGASPDAERLAPSVSGVALKETVVGGVAQSVTGQEKSATRVSYFKGSDASQWQSDLSTYQVVSLGEPYPGIGLELVAYGDNVEKLFTVQPGADPGQITLQLEGAETLTINEAGQLVAHTALGPVSFTKPIAYQHINGRRVEVEVSYTLNPNPKSKIANPKSYGFSLSPYNPHHPLIIDPLLVSTFLGGSDSDVGRALALDGSGNVYVTGYTRSSNFPTTGGAYTTTHSGDYDVYVARLNSTLTTLEASTFLGGSDNDLGFALAIDGSGNVYVAGYTLSSDFPTTGGAYTTTHSGDYDVFVARLDSTLTTLEASTFLGGGSYDYGNALALDGSGKVYVTGNTLSSNFPTTGGAYTTTHRGFSDVFVARLNSTLTTLEASTFLGGSGNEYAYALAIDGSGNVYVAGHTNSSNFPTTGGAYATTRGGAYDVFVARLNSTLTTLEASTFLGGSNDDKCRALAFDGSGNVYITGWTWDEDTDFPTTDGAYTTTHSGDYDVFVARLNSTLTTLEASTFLGGSGEDAGNALALDGSGKVYVLGRTLSSNFPTTGGAYTTTHSGQQDVFVARLNSTLTTLEASTFLGGSNTEWPVALALDGSDNVYVAGHTESSNFPTTGGAYATTHSGSYDVYVARLHRDMSFVLADLQLSGGDNQTTLTNNSFDQPLQVTFVYTDNSNLVAGRVITFTAPGSGAGLSGPQTLTATTNISGVA